MINFEILKKILLCVNTSNYVKADVLTRNYIFQKSKKIYCKIAPNYTLSKFFYFFFFLTLRVVATNDT